LGQQARERADAIIGEAKQRAEEIITEARERAEEALTEGREAAMKAREEWLSKAGRGEAGETAETEAPAEA
jgi:vacuolar-type H+-ATPase subunit H